MRTRASAALVALALAAVTVAFAVISHRLLATSGLGASCSSRTGSGTVDAFQADHDPVSTRSVRAHSARYNGAAFTCEWRGYLIVPATASYRVAAVVDDSVEIEIDRHSLRARQIPTALGTLPLKRGLHPILIRYGDAGGRQALDVLWAAGSGTPSQIPAVLLVPQIVSSDDIRLRRTMAWLNPVVPALASAALLGAAAWMFGSWLRAAHPAGRTGARGPGIAVMVMAAIAFTAAIWWGLPDRFGWAPDEVTPEGVLTALDLRFMGGWAPIYPPVHYAVLAIFTLPFHALAYAGALDLDELRTATALFLVHRAVSVVMALGTVWLVLRIGRAALGGAAGTFAALTLICTLPLAYYAKLANVDVPYLFWFTVSMVFYLRAHQGDARPRDFVLFAAFGALAIATKDQAYGLYVLPALVMTFRAIRHARDDRAPAGVPTLRTLIEMGAAAAAVLVIGHNAILNLAGFREHVRFITGPGADYRLYPATAPGQFRLLAASLVQMPGAMSWPLFLAAAASAAIAWRARITAIRVLLLPALSYYLTFIAVIGYHYDRFFLPPIVIFSLAAGWGLDRWCAPGGRLRALRVAATAAAFAYALARVAAIDALMMRDPRTAAETWLMPHADAHARIAAAGGYLPRRATLFWTPMALDLEELETAAPDLVVVNAAYATRDLPGSRRAEFYQALSNGRTGYRRVFAARTYLWWSPLNLETRFTSTQEDPSSNLSKLNPLIEVYAK